MIQTDVTVGKKTRRVFQSGSSSSEDQTLELTGNTDFHVSLQWK